MAQVAAAPAPDRPRLFNSPLETSIRTLLILDAFYPRACSISELTWFDHLVVHTRDVGGPDSLHPDLPSRGGELLVRRSLIDEAVHLLLHADLITVVDGDEGLRFRAGDDAPSFTELLAVPYAVALKDRARWLAKRFGDESEERVREVVHERLGRWTLEFQGEESLYEPAA